MRLDRLAHPAPLAALLLLLLNDFALKARFPGVLTGKLSDFAGLYLFAVFCIAVFPRAPRRATAAVALGWVAWKTPLSAPLIAAWNATDLPAIGRVLDPTDLLALAVLPFALIEPSPLGSGRPRRLAGATLAMLSVFAFAATSVYRPPYNLPGEYTLPIPADQVLARIHALRLDYGDDGVPPGAGEAVSLRLPPGDSLEAARGSAWDFPVVIFEVGDAPGGSVVRLREVYMPSRFVARDSVRAWFERRVLERIRRNQPNPFPRPPMVSGADALFRPRVVAPVSLTEARGRVTIRLARPASVALIEVSPQNEWRLIYPVAADDERMLPAGESTLTTLCATTKVRGDYGPRDEVPPCGVAVPVTPASAAAVPRPGRETARAFRDPAVGVGRMILLAADAPLSRAALESALADPAFPKRELGWPEVQSALGRLVRRSGGQRAAASETLLRR